MCQGLSCLHACYCVVDGSQFLRSTMGLDTKEGPVMIGHTCLLRHTEVFSIRMVDALLQQRLTKRR